MSPLEQRRAARRVALALVGAALIFLVLAAVTGPVGPVDVSVPVALGAFGLVAATIAGVVTRHVRRFEAPAAQLVVDASPGLVALLAIVVGVYVLVTHSLGHPAAVAAASGAGGAKLTWWVVRWWRTPLRLLPHPHPGEIWWARVPFEDTTASKDRPCLVLDQSGYALRVLMFTSQDKSGRAGYVPVPAHLWRQPRRSFLRTDRVIRVRVEDLRRLETRADAATLAAAGLPA